MGILDTISTMTTNFVGSINRFLGTNHPNITTRKKKKTTQQNRKIYTNEELRKKQIKGTKPGQMVINKLMKHQITKRTYKEKSGKKNKTLQNEKE